MRTFLAGLIAAGCLLVAVPSVAGADSLGSTWDRWGYGQGCMSTFQVGVPGAYGAWGNYIDGCTATMQCKYDYCKVTLAEGSLWNNDKANYWGSYATCNSRLRLFSSTGALLWWRDGSSSGSPDCRVKHTVSDVRTLRRGMWATVQTNGVRVAGEVGARAYSIIDVQKWDPPIGCLLYGTGC